MRLAYMLILVLLFLPGCSQSDLSVEEIINKLNNYKMNGTQKSLNNAEALLQKGLSAHPNDLKLLKEMIIVNLHQGDWEDMEKYLNKGMEIDPNNEDFIFYRIKLLFGRNNYDKLISESNSYVENIRSNLIKANIYHLLGSVYDSMKREVEAETVYLKAEELYQSVGEENVLIYNDIGSFYANNGDLDLAKEYFGKSLEINANNYQVVNNMGNVFYNKGNIEKALHFFERSLILNPNQPGLREVVEKLKKELGQKQKTE